MCKKSSGYFKETVGAERLKEKSAILLGKKTKKKDESSIPQLFDNGHISYDSIADYREFFMEQSVERISELLQHNGYEVLIRDSIHKSRGSTAKIIEVTNASKERNIKQVQVSSEGTGRHGNIPCVKISTSDIGKIKIIDGLRKDYKTDGTEKARLIFRREESDPFYNPYRTL